MGDCWVGWVEKNRAMPGRPVSDQNCLIAAVCVDSAVKQGFGNGPGGSPGPYFRRCSLAA
jgi:hypothetical protein